MAWIRSEDPPEKIKVSFEVSAKDHPELARFIWSLPYRGASKTLRDILSAAVKGAESAAAKPGGRVASTGAGGGGDSTPGAEEVSAAAANIIHGFDKMFP